MHGATTKMLCLLIEETPRTHGRTYKRNFWCEFQFSPSNKYHLHGLLDTVLIACTLRVLLPGLQKLDGIQGNLVIRTPKSTDRNGNKYDMDVPDHTLMILDWLNTTAVERFPGLLQRLPGQLPIAFLLDDRRRTQVFNCQTSAGLHNLYCNI